MKEFRISLNEEVGGHAFLQAENEVEARKKAQQILDDEGIEGFSNKEDIIFDIKHRETFILDVEENE